ncbi:hypothetical protein EYF80_060559 [Liparis tanakae]|uniref:Uncharacterized protein n=1 Tax=Liparis tanakae TaxID=230148 RepID=A0A4Z2EKF1_9TELE|nr:hypothetical protein EYF80_060559 [Liparis tanakae]
MCSNVGTAFDIDGERRLCMHAKGGGKGAVGGGGAGRIARAMPPRLRVKASHISAASSPARRSSLSRSHRFTRTT